MKPIRTIIFAKAPLPGFAKTRLIPALGEAGAARLAQKMLATTLDNVIAANMGNIELCVTPNANDVIWDSLSIPNTIMISAQGEGDLGERMARACRRAAEQKESAILIGTDCPELSMENLQRVATVLQTHDAVVIPATDGGYVLLGINSFHASLFNNIVWSTDTVFKETHNRLLNLGWRIHIMPPLHDIDEPNDMQWLPAEWLL